MRAFDHLPKFLPHALGALVLFGCGADGPTTPSSRAPTMSASLGDGVTATVAQPTNSAPAVVITDSHGSHPSGVTVTFTVDTASGTIAQATATTDASGVASAGSWTLGTRVGAQHLTATATVDGTALTTKFTATATADRPASLDIVSGGAQDGPFGVLLVTPMVVKAADKYGNPSSGATVRFAIDSGAVMPSVPVGVDGTASTTVRLPRTTGQVTVTASVDSGPSVTSTFTSRGVRFASFSLFANTACALSVEGYPYCWGSNSADVLVPLGVPTGHDALAPVPIPGAYNFSEISLGGTAGGGCGLQADGTAVCWGSNMYGESGTGSETQRFEPMRPIASNLRFVEIRRGTGITCGTSKGGQSYCWGGNSYMSVGAASFYQSTSLQPVLLDGNHTFHSYSGGWFHMCAVDADGAAYCWGTNLNGRLGVAAAAKACDIIMYDNNAAYTVNTTCAPSPVAVNTTQRFTSLSASLDATCALSTPGDVYCWGANTGGELATGDTTSSATPVRVSGLPPIKEIHGGGWSFCALATSGDIYCWGSGSAGYGTPAATCGSSGNCMTPEKLNLPRQFSTIAFEAGQLCGLSAGVAYCWGDNSYAALGIGTTGTWVATPTPIAGQAP